MRRVILWLAAILITFAIGVGADQLWGHFLAAPSPTPKADPVAVDIQPQREIVYVPAAAPPPPPPQPNLILDYDANEFSLAAVFYVMGPKSKEFADIDSMEIILAPGYDGPGSIFVYTRKGDDNDSAQATFALVTERRIFFTTSKLKNRDFEYRFDGELLRKDFDAVEGKNKAVLRGMLTKTKNGRTVAQQELSFRMEYMGC